MLREIIRLGFLLGQVMLGQLGRRRDLILLEDSHQGLECFLDLLDRIKLRKLLSKMLDRIPPRQVAKTQTLANSNSHINKCITSLTSAIK